MSTSRRVTREQIMDMMKFNKQTLYRNPNDFDCPPPNYEKHDVFGWTILAKAIVSNEGGLQKYINYAQRFKEKIQDWQNLPFIKSYVSEKHKKKKHAHNHIAKLVTSVERPP